MRGDSLRDLYAKTLALLGLGVLAGTGALVDYWPVGVTHLPVLPSRIQTTALPGPLPVSAVGEVPMLAAVTAVASSRPAAPMPGRDRSREVPTRRLVSDTQPSPKALPLVDDLPPTGRQVLLASYAAPVNSELDAGLIEAEPALRADEVGFRTSDFGLTVASLDVDALPQLEGGVPRVALDAGSLEDGDSSLIGGAFRKTGSSIVKTGVRTGASIFDAMRFVSDAVRRALPTD